LDLGWISDKYEGVSAILSARVRAARVGCLLGAGVLVGRASAGPRRAEGRLSFPFIRN
jgi:hypothetical protein